METTRYEFRLEGRDREGKRAVLHSVVNTNVGAAKAEQIVRETCWPMKFPRGKLLTIARVLVLLLCVATVRGATVRAVSYNDATYAARAIIYLDSQDGAGSVPFVIPLEDKTSTGIGGGHAGARYYEASIPAGKYSLRMEMMTASGDFDISLTKSVHVVAGGEVWFQHWITGDDRLSYGPGQPQVDEPGGEQVSPVGATYDDAWLRDLFSPSGFAWGFGMGVTVGGSLLIFYALRRAFEEAGE